MVAGFFFNYTNMIERDRQVDTRNILTNGGRGSKIINSREGSNLAWTISPSTFPSAVSYLVTVQNGINGTRLQGISDEHLED